MWGSMHSGSVANAIPRTGEIVGTLRALDVAGWKRAKHWITSPDPAYARKKGRATA